MGNISSIDEFRNSKSDKVLYNEFKNILVINHLLSLTVEDMECIDNYIDKEIEFIISN